MRWTQITLTVLLGLAIFVPVSAQVPTVMNYQGRLTDNTPQQNPITAMLPMEFRIYGSLTGSDLLWSESWESVAVNDGIFSVLLGSNGTPLTAAVFVGGTTRYLEIVLNDELLMPRQQLGSTAFAMQDEPSNELNTNMDLVGTDLQLTDASGTVTTDLSSLAIGDNLGNHTATQTLEMNNYDVADVKELYLNNWIRWSDTDGLYWSNLDWHIYPNSAQFMNIRTGSTVSGGLRLMNSGVLRGHLYWDADWFGWLNNAAQWQLRTRNDDGFSPNLYFDEVGNESWTGNPGLDQGKIEYNSNRFYIASGSNSAEVIRFRRSDSDVAIIDNTGKLWSSGGLETSANLDVNGTSFLGHQIVSDSYPLEVSGACHSHGNLTCYYGGGCVSCPADTVVIGGGCAGSHPRYGSVAESYPLGNSEWCCSTSDNLPDYFHVVYAICARIGN